MPAIADGDLRRLVACVALAVAACLPPPALEPSPGRGRAGVEVTAPLSAGAAEAFFAMGRDASFQPFGAEATVLPASPPLALGIFREVPEGRQRVEVVGYGTLALAPPSPPGFPASALCVTDSGVAAIEIVSGGPRAFQVATTAVACAHLGTDRRVLESAYTPAATDPTFGSTGGRAIATLYLDGWASGAVVRLIASPAGLGLFPRLPDTAGGETWPDLAAWSREVAVTTDENGDARAVAVVAPGTDSVMWEVVASAPGEADARVRGWVSAARPACDPAACDDGEPCTDDACDAAGACVHAPRAAGTACGVEAACVAGACTAAVRIDATEQTGWASSEGGFNRNHAELRCGDDGRGAGGYELYPGLTFDVSALPTGLAVGWAELHVDQVRVEGTHTYGADLHEVVVETVRYVNMWEADEVAAVADGMGQRLVSATADLGWRVVEVTPAVVHELAAGRTLVQLRLRFTPAMHDGDTEIDWAVFASDNDPTIERRPYLLVFGR